MMMIDPMPPYAPQSDTSYAAAKAAAPHAGAQRERVYAMLYAAGPQTAEALGAILGLGDIMVVTS